jgi:tRNA A-37 threonylcarbamoyl transferase component Bud32
MLHSGNRSFAPSGPGEPDEMISCRIVLNELPDDVIDHVLCVDEVTQDDSHWRILANTAASRTFRFISKPGAPAWFVRWGFNYSWRHIKEAALGRDEATLDWQRTAEAERSGIPVARYRLLGVPRLITASMDTLLVTEYIESARSASDFIKQHAGNGLLAEDFLIQLGERLALIHACGFVHGNFSLDNVIVQYDDPSRLTITDWYKSRPASADDTRGFQRDVERALAGLALAGVRPEQAETFFNTYATRHPWAVGRFGDLFLAAGAIPAHK